MLTLQNINRIIRTATIQIIHENQSRSIKRWVAPTLREIRKRRNKFSEKLSVVNRKTFIDWNYDAELYAFGRRLNEEFKPSLLQEAFTDRSYIFQEEKKQRNVGIDNPQIHMADNSRLIARGEEIIAEYVITFLNVSLPKLPREGIKAIYQHMVSESVLADISMHLGTSDLILSAEFPVSDSTLASSLKAIVGALFESSGDIKAYEFIRDFICTQLNQKNLMDYWQIDQPMELLKDICKDLKLGEPEPRLIKAVGKNSLLAAYQIGIYSNKKQLGTGFGENIDTAITVASLDCLSKLFGISSNMKPLNYKLSTDEIIKALSKPLVASVERT